MYLRFVFLRITGAVSWLRLSRHAEAWKIAEILILGQLSDSNMRSDEVAEEYRPNCHTFEQFVANHE